MLIEVTNLSKTFRVPVREPGLAAAMRSMLRPRFREVHAVQNVSFTIDAGEMVGFIGPNGAGKTTTLKMLSGLLHPTGGTARAMGYIPWERRYPYLQGISMVMGNRSELNWSITVADSFAIFRDIYNIPMRVHQSRVDELLALFEVEDLLPKQARNLSLGERARCEFIIALLHSPKILYLDEPTLGMDTAMQIRLRQYISDYNIRHGTTVMLTSHYMSDIQSMCRRVLLIDHGQLLFDGALPDLAERIAPYKLINLAFEEGAQPELPDALRPYRTAQDGPNMTLRVDKASLLSVVSHCLSSFRLRDLSVENPPVEAVIDQVYKKGVGV